MKDTQTAIHAMSEKEYAEVPMTNDSTYSARVATELTSFIKMLVDNLTLLNNTNQIPNTCTELTNNTYSDINRGLKISINNPSGEVFDFFVYAYKDDEYGWYIVKVYDCYTFATKILTQSANGVTKDPILRQTYRFYFDVNGQTSVDNSVKIIEDIRSNYLRIYTNE